MGLAENHRKRAEDCFKFAQLSHDARHKSLWLDLAQSWLSLAQRAAKESEWQAEARRRSEQPN
jgi:hypothetical protein